MVQCALHRPPAGTARVVQPQRAAGAGGAGRVAHGGHVDVERLVEAFDEGGVTELDEPVPGRGGRHRSMRTRAEK